MILCLFVSSKVKRGQVFPRQVKIRKSPWAFSPNSKLAGHPCVSSAPTSFPDPKMNISIRTIRSFSRSRSSLNSSNLNRFYSTPPSSEKADKENQESSRTSTPPPTSSTPTPSPPSPPTEPSFTSSLSRTSAEANSRPLPYLSTPLGVSSPPPRGGKLSWTERRDNYFDPEVRNQRRKAIVKEATRGYFHDFHNMTSHGGKTWRSAMTLIKEEVSIQICIDSDWG